MRLAVRDYIDLTLLFTALVAMAFWPGWVFVILLLVLLLVLWHGEE